jgi:hypothetical protein
MHKCCNAFPQHLLNSLRITANVHIGNSVKEISYLGCVVLGLLWETECALSLSLSHTHTHTHDKVKCFCESSLLKHVKWYHIKFFSFTFTHSHSFHTMYTKICAKNMMPQQPGIRSINLASLIQNCTTIQCNCMR